MKPIEILDILNDMYANIPEDFCEDTVYTWFDRCASDLERELGQSVNYNCGVSKVALIFENEDFVIKIPFKGHYEMIEVRRSDKDEDEEEREVDQYYDEYYEEEIFSSFECAPCFEEIGGDYPHIWNYCNAEVSAYEEAEMHGMGEYLAREYLLGFIHDHPVYVQERAVTYEDDYDNQSISDEDREQTKSVLEQHNLTYNMPLTWIHAFIEAFGEKEFIKFDKFCFENGYYSDMHYGNFGYTYNGHLPILIDYTGYEG